MLGSRRHSHPVTCSPRRSGESYNFAKFLGHLKDRRGALGPVKLSAGDLIVLDEASMFSNPDLGDIVDYAARTGVKVAMALDHQQLQAVESGGGASLITRTQGYVQLPEPVRFSEEWERTASLALREGKVEALVDYAEHGRIRAGTSERLWRPRPRPTSPTRWKARTAC